jgi:hypothetical protein
METATIEQPLITFDQLPNLIGKLYSKIENIEKLLASQPTAATPLSKYVDIKGASEITGKTPNALRVQISHGNLQSIKNGSRHCFERSYLEQWLVDGFNKKGRA